MRAKARTGGRRGRDEAEVDDYPTIDDKAIQRIEHELAVLSRRAERFRMATAEDSRAALDRSAYLLLSYLHNHGRVRLTTLGTVFALDISTVSRQVAALAASGLVLRTTDPTDRRASLVTLSPLGRERYLTTRSARVKTISGLVETWRDDELNSFGTLLGRLNAAIAERDRTRILPAHESYAEPRRTEPGTTSQRDH